MNAIITFATDKAAGKSQLEGAHDLGKYDFAIVLSIFPSDSNQSTEG